jgi:DNA-binding LacI/PurR family transcriptional regulator
MVTTYDIAKRARVNQGTVSRVLNGSGRINPKTAERVLQVCRELDYVPNVLAKSLKSNRTNTIAVHVPFEKETVLADPFVTEFIYGVTQEASSHSYNVLFFYANLDDPEYDFSSIVKSRRADGIIITSPQLMDSRIEVMTQEDIPCVLGNYDGVLGRQMACVDIDNYDVGYRSTSFFLARGYRKIGLVTEPQNNLVARDFYAGYADALKNAGLLLRQEFVKQVSVTVQAGRQVARDLLQGADVPEAIIVNTALTAMGVLDIVSRSEKPVRVLVPETALIKELYPNLPRFKSSIAELGRQMTQTLINILKTGKTPKNKVLLQAQVVDEDDRIFSEER